MTNTTTGTMTAEARELREVVVRLVEERGRPGTLDESLVLWDELVGLGVRDIGVAEDRGGSGGTLAELAAVAIALAEQGVSVPLVEASAGRWAAAARGLDAPADADGLISVGSPGVASPGAGSGSGADVALPWGRAATAAVVCRADEARLVPVQRLRESENLAGEPLDTMSLDDGAWRAAPVLAVPPAVVLDRAALLRAAALFGAARGAYTLTREYTRERQQFGGPLLDLPAVAGHLATMKVELVQAEAALTRAVALAEETDAERASSAVRVATVICSGVAGEVARLAHQLHGAIGITAEYPLHHFTRRIWAWRDFPGPAAEAARELGTAALAGGESHVWSELTGWYPVMTGE